MVSVCETIEYKRITSNMDKRIFMGRGRTRLPEGALDTPLVVRVTSGLLAQVDDLAAEKGLSRSWIVRRALKEYIERHPHLDPAYEAVLARLRHAARPAVAAEEGRAV